MRSPTPPSRHVEQENRDKGSYRMEAADLLENLETINKDLRCMDRILYRMPGEVSPNMDIIALEN